MVPTPEGAGSGPNAAVGRLRTKQRTNDGALEKVPDNGGDEVTVETLQVFLVTLTIKDPTTAVL